MKKIIVVGGGTAGLISALILKQTLMAKKLKQLCGVGGGYKNKEIYIQGNQRDKVSKFLQNLGASVKLKGG